MCVQSSNSKMMLVCQEHKIPTVCTSGTILLIFLTKLTTPIPTPIPIPPAYASFSLFSHEIIPSCATFVLHSDNVRQDGGRQACDCEKRRAGYSFPKPVVRPHLAWDGQGERGKKRRVCYRRWKFFGRTRGKSLLSFIMCHVTSCHVY